MPAADHLWRWHRSESAKTWLFSYLNRMNDFEHHLAIQNASEGVEPEVVDLSAT